MKERNLLEGYLLARNSLLNLVCQTAVLLVGLATIPFIVRMLGKERFGILSLSWVVLGYFTIFDIGLAKAATKRVAELLGRGENEEVSKIVWTTVMAQGALGLAGGVAFYFVTPLLVEHLLKIPAGLTSEAKNMFFLLSLSVPILLVSSSFTGVLEAAQRFDYLNAVRIPSNSAIFILGLLGAYLDMKLGTIIILIIMSKIIALIALIHFCFNELPCIRRVKIQLAYFPQLLTYGKWIALSSLFAPLLLYIDRFLLATILSVVAVTFYTVTYEAITRLWVIPMSLVSVLFPAFSTLKGIEDREKLDNLLSRSIRIQSSLLLPIVIGIVHFARPLLTLWMGREFAEQSAVVLQTLAIGIGINSVAWILYTLLDSTGRPDIKIKMVLIELPLYIPLAIILIKHNGISGAALAWTCRASFDLILVLTVCHRIIKVRIFARKEIGRALGAISALALFTLVLNHLKMPLSVQGSIFLLIAVCFLIVTWVYVFDDSDRLLLKRFLRPVKTEMTSQA